MSSQIGGTKPRPRVALLGAFNEKEKERARVLFPTIYGPGTLGEVSLQVDVKEIDLLIIGGETNEGEEWAESVPVISFSQFSPDLPGPYKETYLSKSINTLNTDGFIKPDLSLPFDRVRELDIQQFEGVKGFSTITLKRTFDFKIGLGLSFKGIENIIKKGAVILDLPHSTLKCTEGGSDF